MRQPSQIVVTVSCTVCGRQKQQSNNWWEAALRHIKAAQYSLTIKSMAHEINPNEQSYYFLCGQECVAKFVQEFLAEQLEKEREKTDEG